MMKNRAIPLYYQVYESLKDMIEQGIFGSGDCIPAEHELEDRFKVSRITVRRAVDELVDEGLLEKRRGLGTFVVDKKYTQRLNHVSGWAETMKAMGMEISTKMLRLEMIASPAVVSRALNIESGAPLLKIWRLRYSSGYPMCIMTNYLRPDYTPGLLEEGFGSEESLYSILEGRYNIKLIRADEVVEARAATEEEGKHLAIHPGAPLLCVKRTTYDDNGIPFEYVSAASRGDRYQYLVSLSGRP